LLEERPITSDRAVRSEVPERASLRWVVGTTTWFNTCLEDVM